jgi:hypothetical protein
MNMQDQVGLVTSREDLASFVAGMQHSLRNGHQWTNRDLGTFLEAMAAWIADMDGYFENIGEACPDSPTWRTFAEILAAATVYE